MTVRPPFRPARPFVATYRVQLTPSFGFDAAAAIVPDLVRLGISHLYLSPVAEAVTGSTHGYDVVDPTMVREALGGRDALHRLAAAAREHDIGIVVDIVPNHVSTTQPERNPWWWATLRDGRAAPDRFDIDWDHGGQQIIVPVLGAPLTDVVAGGELLVDGDILRYHDRTFPLRADGPAGSLADVVDGQHYRLQYWRDPDRNVRRFFTIDELVAIRPEVPAVAGAVHGIVADLAAAGLLDGVRVDHIDGLADPAGYLDVLRATVGEARWVAVEKIVVGDERLPDEWPVQGTTGYEWIRAVDHLFTHPAGEEPLTRLWQETTGDSLPYHEHERDGIRAVLAAELRPDVQRVARSAARELPGLDRRDLETAICALTVELGRYRTYLGSSDGNAGDVALVQRAGAAAAANVDARVVPTLRSLVDLIVADVADDGIGLIERIDGVGGVTTRRWQQLTGPALAKGGEDRALYRSLRLAAHNEVGGDPGMWTLSLDAFHAHNAAVAERWPATLLAGSTHDTKRSEDVRARMLVVAEDAPNWLSLVASWQSRLGNDTPSGAATLLGLQTAVGAWPIDRDRLGEYLVKAAREAAVHTGWADPDDEYETALHRLAGRLTEPPLANDIGRYVEEIEPAARHISLAQLVLRCTAPGVADVYQGGESWLHTLVDPDNRGDLVPDRLRLAADAALAEGPVWESAQPKAAVLARTLGVRRRVLEAFAPSAAYVALRASGAHADHVIAFARCAAGAGDAAAASVLTVASRSPRSRPTGWLDTDLALPEGVWYDALDPRHPPFGGTVPLIALLDDRPAALLTSPKF